MVEDDGAAKRRGELDQELGRFRERWGGSITSSFDPDTGAFDYVSPSLGIPEAIPLLLGEVATHVRSALDYLVYALAWLGSGEPQENTQYPIARSPEQFAGMAPGRLRGVRPDHVEAIRRHQPFVGADWLLMLHRLSNPDKHKQLSTVGTAVVVEFFADGRAVPPKFGRLPAASN